MLHLLLTRDKEFESRRQAAQMQPPPPAMDCGARHTQPQAQALPQPHAAPPCNFYRLAPDVRMPHSPDHTGQTAVGWGRALEITAAVEPQGMDCCYDNAREVVVPHCAPCAPCIQSCCCTPACTTRFIFPSRIDAAPCHLCALPLACIYSRHAAPLCVQQGCCSVHGRQHQRGHPHRLED